MGLISVVLSLLNLKSGEGSMAKSSNGYPTYIGWYQPHSRWGDCDGTYTDPVTGEVSTPPSMTKQSMVAECDINNIIKTYQMTGVIAHINSRADTGVFMDLPDEIDFQESLHLVERSRQAFAALPSVVRNRFANDPARFLEFLSDPANREEAGRLGLLKAPARAPEVAQEGKVSGSTASGGVGGGEGNPSQGSPKGP